MRALGWVLISTAVVRLAAAEPAADGTAPTAGSGSDQAADAGPPAPPEPETRFVRRRDATARQMFRGPFQSSRLFAMPTADTVGPYILSLAGDGSLLQQPGVLSSAGVLAIGFGDIAQLEYRHSSAISVTGVNAPLPAVGVQLRIPIPQRSGVPAIGISFRLGRTRRETFGATNVDETVTDLYVVVRERVDSVPWLTLHAGLRISPAKIKLSGDTTFKASETLKLPTAGLEIAVNPTAKVVVEAAYAPRFRWNPGDPMASIDLGVLGRLGVRWSLLPSVTLDASFGYQIDPGGSGGMGDPKNVVQQWDIRIGAELFIPWGALACSAAGVFCE